MAFGSVLATTSADYWTDDDGSTTLLLLGSKIGIGAFLPFFFFRFLKSICPSYGSLEDVVGSGVFSVSSIDCFVISYGGYSRSASTTKTLRLGPSLIEIIEGGLNGPSDYSSTLIKLLIFAGAIAENTMFYSLDY